MSRFSMVLRRAAARLDLPQPERSRVLLEMAADLEDLFTAYRQRGLGEEEAERKVAERLDASDQTLLELTRVHRSGFRRWTDRFSEQARTRWERVMLVAILLFVVTMTGPALVRSDFFRNASGFVWPTILLGIGVVAIFVGKAYRLFLKKDHRVRGLRRWLPALLMLACAALFNGAFGYFVTLHATMMRIASGRQDAGELLMGWLLGGTATMILSLLVATLAALLWFVLMNKVLRIERAEAALILEEG